MSTLSLALNTALSGLQVNQTALSVTSNNIANANTDGYTRKIADLKTVLIDGQGGGVEVSNIIRIVDNFLVRDMREQLSTLGAAEILNRYYSNTQDMFGLPESSASIANTLTELANNFHALSIDPESPTAQRDTVNSAQILTRQFNKLSKEVQDLRMEANLEIDALVDRANVVLENIAELNVEISRGVALGKPIGDLEDQRDLAVAELAKTMDISYFIRDNGQMLIFTGNGSTLVDTTAVPLTYSASASISADTNYPGSIDGIDLGSADITTVITSGKLKSLIDLRDTILPGMADQIDELATVMREELDAIHNDGAAVPPANALTGETTFTDPATDTVNLTGVVRIGVVDANGKIVGTPIDLDLDDLQTVVGGNPTVEQVRDAINGVYAASVPAIPGLAGATASINASNQLVITAGTATNGIAINEGTSNESTTSRGFSHYFGLNNLFTGTTTSGLASNITVRAAIVADPQLLVRGELSEATLASGDAAVTIGDNTVVRRLFTKFQDNMSFSAAGTIPPTTSSLAGYGAAIVSTNANLASRAADDYLFREVVFEDSRSRADSTSGVNVDEELSNLILYQNAYSANARMISTLSEIIRMLSELAI